MKLLSLSQVSIWNPSSELKCISLWISWIEIRLIYIRRDLAVSCKKMIFRRGELFIGITPNFLFFFHPQKTGSFYSGHLFTCGEASALRKRFCYYHFMLRFGLFIYKEIQPWVVKDDPLESWAFHANHSLFRVLFSPAENG